MLTDVNLGARGARLGGAGEVSKMGARVGASIDECKKRGRGPKLRGARESVQDWAHLSMSARGAGGARNGKERNRCATTWGAGCREDARFEGSERTREKRERSKGRGRII